MGAEQDWVALVPRFTPGWPWPEESFGLDPVYGPDGWCRSCGAPKVEQSGPLHLQGHKFPTAGAFTPNWMFDVVGVSASVAEQVETRFQVPMRAIHKPSSGATDARQLVPQETDERWYDDAGLESAVRQRRGAERESWLDQTCPSCGTRRWLPVSVGTMPVRAQTISGVTADLIASPERFGSGLSSFRHLLFSRSLAQLLKASAPRNWDVREVRFA